MQNERNAFKAGLFIIISIALIFTVTVMIKGVNRFTENPVIRTVQFSLTDNIGGLRIGDDVRIGGLRIGNVKSIELKSEKDEAQKILVSFTIPGRIPLHKNAHLVVESTVTGTSNLNIDNVGDGEMLAENDSLMGSPGSLTTLLANASQIMPLVKDTVAQVKTEMLPRVNKTIDKYGATADTGKDALANIRDIFGDSKDDFRGTMKNLNNATGTIDKKLPQVMDDLHAALEKAKGTVDNINVVLEDVKKTVANTRDITASGRSILVGNKSKIDNMIASLKIAGDNLKAATAEVRHSPWRLLYKPTPAEIGNLTLYDSARHFSDGANSLNDAASALRDALKDPNTKDDPKKIQSLVDQLDKSFANFTEVEGELLKSVKQ